MFDELSKRIAALSPEQRAVFEQRLKQRGLQAPQIQTIPKRATTDPVPLSFGQQRLWFLHQLEPGNPAYNGPSAVELSGPLDIAVLERSLNDVVRRHEVLRTTVAIIDDRPAQVIVPTLWLPLQRIDLRSYPAAEREAESLRRAAAEFQQPFDLSTGPLLRATLLQLDETEFLLLFTMHHIITDGWSTELLVEEVATLYAAFVAGQPSPLPELPIQYPDFAVWQRERLQGDALSQQIGYWKQQLADAPERLNLPTDRPRPAAQTYGGAVQAFDLPPALSTALTALSQREGVTLFMLLLAVFNVLLQRYSGQSDILVGTSVSGRSRSEISRVMGFFANTLVLRTDLTGQPTFRQLVQRVRTTALQAYAHQDLPFELLVEELNPQRSLSHAPLFQVVFTLQNELVPTREVAGVTMRPRLVDTATTKLDLIMFMWEGREQLTGTLEYSTDLFDAATITRLIGHFRTLLEAITADPDRPIFDLPLLTSAETRQLLDAWSTTAAAPVVEQCIHQTIADQAMRAPDAVAIVCGATRAQARQLTYAELDRQANQLGHWLQSRGVGPETRVGLCIERSPELIVGMLGILKAGAAYVPLDPAYPAERLQAMLDDAQAPVIVTRRHLAEKLRQASGRYCGETICLDADWEAIEAEPRTPPDSTVTADNLAYVIYTSGSTGQPKGVLISHRNLANSTQVRRDFYHEPVSAFLLLSSVAFDSSVAGMFWTLSQGGALCLPDEGSQADPEVIAGLVARERISHMLCLPALYALVLAQAQASQLATLRTVIVAGETCPSELIDRHRELLSQTALFNEYGPTEGTVWCTAYHCCAPEIPQPVPIGRPIPNAQIYVLDAALRPVPIGVGGELYLGGAGLARGYHNRPDLTAELFVPHPFAAEPGARLYRTGDLARFRPNGDLQLLGRSDQQVKLRGFRIELEEIQAVLRRHPLVSECVVMAREDGPGVKRLVAYVVENHDPGSGGSQLQASSGGLDSADLRQYVGEQLPEYMIPSAFVLLPALPRTPNGKLDRAALPAPDRLRRAPSDFVAPRTPVEYQLATIWAEILDLGRIGVTDNFFVLGGHSLLATQVVSRVRDTLQIELPLRAIFEAPTVGALAARIESLRRTTQAIEVLPIQPVARDQPLDLSFAQERLWVLDQLMPGNLFYNMPTAVLLTGLLDDKLLQRSLDEVVCRHESIRTTFAQRAGRPVQIIAPALAVPLRLIDLRALPVLEQDAEVRRQAVESVRQPFDLATGPLLRVTLFRLTDQRHVLFLAMHHSISDGWSLGVLVQEVAALYAAFASGAPSPLPPLPIQYADYAVWQREWLQSGVAEAQLGYWKAQLVGMPQVLDLPTDRPRPPVRTANGALQSRVLPAELASALHSFSQREGVTPFMTLLTAFNVVLHCYSGQDRIVVGSPIANRNRRDIEGLIGCFINALALPTDLRGNPTLRELLARVRETTLGAYANQELPFERLVAELQPTRDLSRTPLFQVMFVLQNTPMPALELPGITLSLYQIDSGSADYDLKLELIESQGRLMATFQYNTDLFEATTIDRLHQHFQIALHGLLAEPEQRLADLTLLTERERHLLDEWNATRQTYPAGGVHTLFEQQVARTPDAVALAFGDQRLSYRELNTRANQLARHLRQNGVGVAPQGETRVVVCMERSIEMVVALLGILKAGGCYVPLDPAYPRERLEWMLVDARPAIVLTQQALAADLPSSGEVVCLDADWQRIAALPGDDLVSTTDDHSAIYAIYTSGSTGRPKGVINTHGGVRNRLLWMQDTYQLTADDRVLQKTPFTFDVSVWELFWPLITGAQLVIARPEGHKDNGYLVDLIERAGITTLHFVPSMLSLFLEEPGLERCRSLRRVICSGEALPAQLQARFFERLGAALHNLYGPTEAAVDVTAWSCAAANQQRSVPIGRPVANTQIYLLDRQLNRVPVGVPGELYIGGAQLARGYLNRPDLTAERFIPDPFAARSGQRLYRTGDLARFRDDGAIEYQGRIDQQVKLRGFRIELEEIEATLRQHPAIREALVMLREDRAGDPRLVAYVVRDQDTRHPALEGDRRVPETRTENPGLDGPGFAVLGSFQELREFVAERLPDYMIPAAFVLLDVLPLTPNGKLDRRVLPAPDADRPDLEKGFVTPRTPTEEVIATLWTEVLGVKQVGVHDNFFELGGHSLRAILLLSRVREVFRVSLPVQSMFEATTVAALAALLIKNEEQPGKIDKIARLLQRIKQTPSQELAKDLEQRRKDGSHA